MTGRGALTVSASRIPDGASRDSALSSCACCAVLSEIASIATRLALTEIFDRGNCANARSA